jgi:hypothetical protein
MVVSARAIHLLQWSQTFARKGQMHYCALGLGWKIISKWNKWIAFNVIACHLIYVACRMLFVEHSSWLLLNNWSVLLTFCDWYEVVILLCSGMLMQLAFCICLPTPNLEGLNNPRMWKTEVFYIIFWVVRFKQNAKRLIKNVRMYIYLT